MMLKKNKSPREAAEKDFAKRGHKDVSFRADGNIICRTCGLTAMPQAQSNGDVNYAGLLMEPCKDNSAPTKASKKTVTRHKGKKGNYDPDYKKSVLTQIVLYLDHHPIGRSADMASLFEVEKDLVEEILQELIENNIVFKEEVFYLRKKYR